MNVEAVVEKLEGARDRLASSSPDYVGAFDGVLEAWRLCRAKELGDLCEIFSQRAAWNQPPITTNEAHKQTERIIDWMNVLRSTTALGLCVLIADVERAFAVNLAPRFLFPRIEAMAAVRDDPRIAGLMVRTAARIQEGGAWRRFLPQYVKAFHMARDPRFVALLDEAIKENSSARALARGAPLGTGTKALRALRVEMQYGPPALPPEARELVAEIHAHIEELPRDFVVPLPTRARAADGDPGALLEEVRRNPDDYELRLVLADALMNVGDPLGELIVLQCRRANNDDIEERSRSLSRERALLAEHMKKWLGPLSSVVTQGSVVFERGFLTKCEAVAAKRVTAEVHFQHEEWATVRSITFRGQARITPQMRALREAFNVDYNGLLQLATTGHPKLKRLNLIWNAVWEGANGPPNEALRLFVACDPAKLPALTHLEIDSPYIENADWLWNAKWCRQLRGLGVSGATRVGAVKWIEELRRRDHLEEIIFLGTDHRVTVRTKENDGDHFDLLVELTSFPFFNIRGLITTLISIQQANLRFVNASLSEETDRQITREQRTSLNQALARFKRRS